jgi:predicted methyltransferase
MPTRFRPAAAGLIAISLSLVASRAPARAQSEINKPFQNPDVAAYVKRFEAESREVYARRDAIVGALRLRPEMAIADVGAGTGLFTRLIAEKVGPRGRVYAVDISPAFLEHIAETCRERGLAQVQTVRGTQAETKLLPASVDLAFLCDAYHHLEQHEAVLASIHRALRPGGRLVVVEFDRSAPGATDFTRSHVRADKAQFLSEVSAAGFEPIPAPGAPRMKENFFAEFRRVERLRSTP